jgi:mRNA-degrading endonuclease RelE of RelBE toxin-antitoxin system
LSHEPTKISGSTIKKMEQPFWSQYRLRVEEFRVYYDVDEPNQTVFIVRVLFKGTKTTRKRKKSS